MKKISMFLIFFIVMITADLLVSEPVSKSSRKNQLALVDRRKKKSYFILKVSSFLFLFPDNLKSLNLSVKLIDWLALLKMLKIIMGDQLFLHY
jgi:hypothetical protein